MDAMAYMFSVTREDSSNVLEFKPECIMQEDLMSLSSKFPLIPGSQRSITFCTTMLSQKLREMPPDADFDLTDPCSPPPRYNVLHDPHLKEYFQNSAMRKRLIEKGFITPSGYVKCTLLEFNMFRQWIRKLKLDRIYQERRRQRQIEIQQWKEKQAREQLLRDEELYSIVREREQKARELKERGIKRRNADRRKYLKLQEEDNKRREKFKEEIKRKKDINENEREKNLAEKQAQKIEEEEKVRKIKIRLLVKRTSEDKRRESMLQKRRQTLMEEKEKKLKETWKRRCSLSLAREKEKSRQEETEREEHIKNVARRTSIVAQQRRKSRAYHDQCLQRRRNTLEKQHQEAENFLEKIRQKKLKDLKLWKQKHQRMREGHLQQMTQQERRVSLQNKSSDHGPEHRRKSSAWDLKSSLKKEFGIDDNVLYSGVVFAGRKPAAHEARQRVELAAVVEEETSRQVEELDQFEKLLSRLEAEFALRERVHYIVFGIISNAQDMLDIRERLEIGKEIPGYVQRIVDAAQRILYGEQTIDADVKNQVRKYILRVINAAASVDGLGESLSADEQTRRAARDIVTDVVTKAKDEFQRRTEIRDTAKNIVTTAINSASQRALAYGLDMAANKDTLAVAEDISKNLCECAKDIVTAAIVSALRYNKDDREVVVARSLAADAVQAAKASLERLYGIKFELVVKEQVDTEEMSTSLDKCAKEMAAAAIISATRSLERAIRKDDPNVTAARSLAHDAVTAAKASLEKFPGVIVELEDEKQDPFMEISTCLVKSARDAAQAVVTSSTRLRETATEKDILKNRAAQSLASDAVQAAVASIEKLYGIKVDPEDETQQTAKNIAAAAVISATGSVGKESKRSDVDLAMAARELASSAVDTVKASINWVHSGNVAPGSKQDAPSVEEAAKKIAEVAVDSTTRFLERIAEKNEWDLAFTTRELVVNVIDSAKASLERLYGIKIDSKVDLLPSSQETSVISSSGDSLESILSVRGHEEELMVAARNLASDAIKSAQISLERLYCIANSMESYIKNTALEITNSLVDSSRNLLQHLEKDGLGIAARELACSAIESAAKSICKLYEGDISVQDIVRSDSRLLKAAAKVSTISARASSGELFDRGFIGGVELEEATDYLATHALISAEAMLEKVQDSSTTADLDLEICKAAFQLASHAVESAEGSVARLEKENQPGPSEPYSDHGTLFWKVTTYVEGLINGALRSIGSAGYYSDINDDLEEYEVISHDQACKADAEYGPNIQDMYQRETLALRASRIVNDVLEKAIDIAKARGINNSFFSVPDVRPGNAQFARRRSSSVHFNERTMFHSRRDSYVPRETDFLSAAKRPPTPRFRKDRTESVVSQEIQELEKELAIPSDNDLNALNVFDSDLVQRRLSDPGPGINSDDPSISEPERSASDSKITIRDQETSLTEKASLYEIIKKREGTASCEISPCGSYVVLPHLDPSECSLIAARVQSYEVLWNQKKTTTSVTSFPSLSPRGSFVVSEAVEQVRQRKESQSRLVPSSSRLPDITSSTSKISKGSSSASLLKQSPEHPKRTSSEQLKKSSPKPSPKSSKESAKLPSKSSVQKGSLGKATSSSRSSNILSPGSSLTKASLSPRASTEITTLSKPTSSQNQLKSSPKTSILFAHADPHNTTISLLGPSSDETVKSPRVSEDKIALTSPASTEKANLSPRVSKGNVLSSPRVSRERVVLSPKTSTAKVTPSPRVSTEKATLPSRAAKGAVTPRSSTENAVLSPSKGKITQSPRASTGNAALSPNVSKGKVTPSPRASAENAVLFPSKSKVTQSPRASTDNAVLSPRVSKGKITHSPRTSAENAVLSSRVSKGKITHSPRTSAENVSTENAGLSPNVSKGKVTPSPRASAENAVLSPSKSKVTQSPRASTDNAVLSPRVSKGKVTHSPRASTENAALFPHVSKGKVMQSPRTSTLNVALTPRVSMGNVTQSPHLSTQDIAVSPHSSKENVLISSRVSSEKTAAPSKVSVASEGGEKENKVSSRSIEAERKTTKLENTGDLKLDQSQGNEVVEKSLASVQCASSKTNVFQQQGVGSELDRHDVHGDRTGGVSDETKESDTNKNLKSVVPSLERIIQDKRLTPEGAEAETRPASSVDVFVSRKYVHPEGLQRNVATKQALSDSVKPSLSKSFSSAAESAVGGTISGPGSSRSSQEVPLSKESVKDEVVTPRKKPEGEDRNEEQGVQTGVGSESPERKEKKKESVDKMLDSSIPETTQAPDANQQLVQSPRDVKEVENYPTYRKVSISRSIHDTVDDIVQRMLSTADEPSAVEVARPSGRGSHEEMKRDSKINFNAPRTFGRERRLPTSMVSNTVIDTVDFMLQSVSASDERRPRQSSGRTFSRSDVLDGQEVPRTASSMARFCRSTSSAHQGISCVYGSSPSPPKLPSPKRSRLWATSSQDSLGIRATQSDSSIVSLSSDKAADLKPKVSGAWLDDVGSGDASVRSQSPKRPHSSPSPSLHRRSSGRLSMRHSLEGVSMETDSASGRAT